MQIQLQEVLQRVLNKIKDLYYRLGLIADYPVEVGTSGVWEYEKWASGKATCRALFSTNVTKWTAWGTVYEGSPIIQRQTFPAGLFIDDDVIFHVMGDGLSGIMGVETLYKTTATQTPQLYPLRPGTASSVTIYIGVEAIGRWWK